MLFEAEPQILIYGSTSFCQAHQILGSIFNSDLYSILKGERGLPSLPDLGLMKILSFCCYQD